MEWNQPEPPSPLFDIANTVDPDRAKTIDELFAEFHALNPDVFDLFVGYARDLIAAGHKRGGARAIIERIRWEYATTIDRQDGEQEFAINNNFVSRYARKAMAEIPDLAGFFETRKQKTK